MDQSKIDTSGNQLLKKIAIDCRVLTVKPAGIPNYLINGINVLAQSNKFKIFLFSNKAIYPEARGKILPSENIYFFEKAPSPLFSSGVVWFLIYLPFLLNKVKPEYFWGPAAVLPPYFYRRTFKNIVSIHDMVAKNYKSTMALRNYLTNFFFHDRAINNADILWTVSHYTKKQIETFFPNRKSRTILIGAGINIESFSNTVISKTDLSLKFSLSSSYVLFVGTIEPRKNLKFAFSLVPELEKLGLSLVVVGAKGWGKSEIPAIMNNETFPKSAVNILGYVSDSELCGLYSFASVLILPSLNEGFGLPIVEAMACGCPVVVAHNSAMVELAENIGITVKSWNINDWISAINVAVANRELFNKKGLKAAPRYEFETGFKKLIDQL